MPRIISVVNQKGGVGKTTTAINLASCLAHMGKFVLLVDLDPQGNASSGIGVRLSETDRGVYHTLIDGVSMRDIAQSTAIDGLRVAPSTIDLAGARIELVNIDRREFRLHDGILEVRNDYDFIIIDCPPSLCLLTVNGLVASEEVLIPVQTEYYALEGLSQLIATIDLVKQNLKPELQITGAVMTMYDDRNKLSQDVFTELYKYFPNKIFRTVVPRNVKLAEAPSFGQSIIQYARRSPGGKAYHRLAREILEQDIEIS
ncbi:MAG: AAA family ATPase [Patescibacteria group bacterium]|nr:AAA family ATPase [Patescibacteria group bacterium]MDD5715729.1 AAA family ATPase [Patescibacteria group bacterium]